MCTVPVSYVPMLSLPASSIMKYVRTPRQPSHCPSNTNPHIRVEEKRKCSPTTPFRCNATLVQVRRLPGYYRGASMYACELKTKKIKTLKSIEKNQCSVCNYQTDPSLLKKVSAGGDLCKGSKAGLKPESKIQQSCVMVRIICWSSRRRYWRSKKRGNRDAWELSCRIGVKFIGQPSV